MAVLLLGIALIRPVTGGAETVYRHQFIGQDAALERAVEDDDPVAVKAALRAGASVNARGAYGVTPVEYAIGTSMKRAAAALFRHGADPNLRDQAGETAVTLAVDLYYKDRELLGMVLDAGGDPNTRRSDRDPVIIRFLGARDLAAITYMQDRGVDLNLLDRTGRALIVSTASATDWDAVWHMIQLGADIDTPRTRDGLVATFRNVTSPPQGSPLYDAKVKVYRLLVSKGLQPVPPVGLTP